MSLKTTIEYLGYILSPSGITISQRHTDVIKNFPLPKKTIQIQRFLGLTNYFRKFIKNYALKAKPLQNLLYKSTKFDFNANCIIAFNTLKQDLISFPILRLYNPFAETELHTDANAIALAGILL